MSEDIGHQAQWTARAEPEECVRLSFQYSRSDTTEAWGLNEILWAEFAYQLPYSFLSLPLHTLFPLPEMPFPVPPSLWILLRTVKIWAWVVVLVKSWQCYSLSLPTQSCVNVHESSALVIMKMWVYTSESSHCTMNTQMLVLFFFVSF